MFFFYPDDRDRKELDDGIVDRHGDGHPGDACETQQPGDLRPLDDDPGDERDTRDEEDLPSDDGRAGDRWTVRLRRHLGHMSPG